jgi:hypothetical protein
VAQVQTDLRRRILRAFVGRGLLESCDAKEMLGYQHSGFSVDAGVCIEADDRAALERLLRYCARPPFAGTACAKRALPWCTAAPCEPTHARACDTQTVEGALPVGRADRPYLRSVPAAVPDVRWTDALDRIHYRGHARIRKILDHIGVDLEPPHISPARGPPLWADCDAQMGDGAQIEPADWDLAAQPAPDFEVDQRINW